MAIVHDWLNQIGGAESVLEALVEMYPQAPIYTSIYWPQAMPEAYRSWDIRTSFMDRLPLVKKHHQPFLPLYPLAFEQFDLRDYDLVISNKSAFCHGVITAPETLHICYCLTPTRFLWDYSGYVQREGLGQLARWVLPPFLSYLRLWEQYEAGESPEARFVRQIDRLEMGLQAALYRAQGMQKMDEFIESARRALSDPDLLDLLAQIEAPDSLSRSPNP